MYALEMMYAISTNPLIVANFYFCFQNYTIVYFFYSQVVLNSTCLEIAIVSILEVQYPQVNKNCLNLLFKELIFY